MQKIIIDTDPGQDIDDLLAIIFALERPELEVLAVTVVTHPCERRARLVKRLLRSLGKEKIPVGVGMNFPLRPMEAADLREQYDERATMNHECFAMPAEAADEPDGGDAVDLIIRTVEAHPGEVLLACIAPLTNIACALARKPSIAKLVKGISLMGGELELLRPEHNIAFDPVAADLVLRSGIPITMGTWSVTRRFVLERDEVARFRQSSRPVHKALGAAIDAWQPVHHWKPGPVMYDLFPMVMAFQPELYKMREQSVRVELAGAYTRGMTLPGGDLKYISVSVDARVPEIRELYLKTVFGKA